MKAFAPMRVENADGGSHLLRCDGLAVTVVTSSDQLASAFGPRFDRTAFVASASLDGGQFLHRHGLCDEFGLRGCGVIGYEEAAVGDTFVKIGVGRLVRDSAAPYFFGHPYPVRERFPIEIGSAVGEFAVRQCAPGLYNYTKRYRLLPGATLELVCTLTNLDESSLPLETYNHNWFAFSGVASTTDYVVEPDFALPGEPAPHYTREERGLRLRTTPEGRGVNWSAEIASARAHHNVTVRAPDGRQVRIEGDFPVARFALWSNHAAVCPELFLRATLAPHEELSWTRRYTFSSAARPLQDSRKS